MVSPTSRGAQGRPHQPSAKKAGRLSVHRPRGIRSPAAGSDAPTATRLTDDSMAPGQSNTTRRKSAATATNAGESVSFRPVIAHSLHFAIAHAVYHDGLAINAGKG